MVPDIVYRQLQLDVLRGLAASFLAVVPFFLYVYPSDSYAHLALRLAILATSAIVMVFATPASTRPLGLLLTLLFFVAPIVRGYRMDEKNVVLWMVVYGSHRLVPMLAAIFHGRAACILSAALSVASPLVVVGTLRARAGMVSWWDAFNVYGAHITSEERYLFACELYYLGTAAVVSIVIAGAFGRALDLLSEALTAKQRFITEMNHEIRTPLVGVLSMAELLLGNRALPADVVASLTTIQTSGRMLLAIISNILSVSKLNARVAAAVTSAVDLKTSLMETADTFLALASAKNVQYNVAVAPDFPSRLVVDDVRLQQILANLIGNALKFTLHGTVQVTIGYAPSGIADTAQLLRPLSQASMTVFRACGAHTVAAPTRLALADLGDAVLNWINTRRGRPPVTTQTAPTVWLQVADTGIGMDAEQLARIVAPYEQASASTMRQFGGSGLGLAICKDLVRYLGGDFVYSSAPGHGSVFVVAIPCLPAPTLSATSKAAVQPTSASPGSPVQAQAQAAPDDAGTAAAAPAATVRKLDGAVRPLVLVADDNPVNLRVIAHQLERIGFAAVCASNGAECVERARGMLAAAPPSTRRRSARLAPVAAADTAAVVPRPVAIFMDLHMPVLDGYEAAREIRAIEAAAGGPWPRVPIFALAADDVDDVLEASLRAGMDSVVRKPVALDALEDIMNKVVGL